MEQKYEQLEECHSPSLVERFVLSHNPLPGQEVARPCTAPSCTFGHGSVEQTLAEMAALQELYTAKAVDRSKSGKAAFSNWRMAHAHAHLNIQPGPHGKPMFHHEFTTSRNRSWTHYTSRSLAYQRHRGSMAS